MALHPPQSTSLYVGDLPQQTTEGVLYELFNPVGPVVSIRVCRDAITRRSLGYAYVNFHSPFDAERALDTLNNTTIQGKTCRIMWSQRDPSVRKSGLGNVFIKNLDKSIDHKALYDTFSDFGNILSCKVVVDEKGVSKGYGFVHYETQKMADEAIEKVNGKHIGPSPLVAYVGPFLSQKDRLKQTAQTFTNVFVKNISAAATYPQVEAIFAKFGPITSAVLKTANGKPEKYGFFNFVTHESAVAAVEHLSNTEFQGKVLYVARAQKKSERRKELVANYRAFTKQRRSGGTNLYVKNLDTDLTDAVFRDEFGKFGDISSALIMRDEKGLSRGFGFVSYATPDEANKALMEMNGKFFGSKPLYVNMAQSFHERQAILEAQRMPILRPPHPFPPHRSVPGMAAFASVGPANLPLRLYPQFIRNQGGRWNNGQSPAVAATPGGFPGPHQNVQYPEGAQLGVARQAPGARQPAIPGAPAAGAQARQPAARRDKIPISGAEPLTVKDLENSSPENQFLMVSQRLYPIIVQQQPELAPKITGMIRSWYLEHKQGPKELLKLLDDPVALDTKIKEAMEIWEEHLRTRVESSCPEGQ